MKRKATSKALPKATPIPPVLDFTVQLSKWRCGGDTDKAKCRLGTANERTSLLNPKGRMCCLGFAARATGYKGKLVGCDEPRHVKAPLPGLNDFNEVAGDYRNTDFSRSAMAINDNTTTTVAEKKRRLIALGKTHNIKVRFAP